MRLSPVAVRLSGAPVCDGRQLRINESSLKMLDPSCEIEAVGTGFICDKGGCDQFHLRQL